jgi:hypothetical protein
MHDPVPATAASALPAGSFVVRTLIGAGRTALLLPATILAAGLASLPAAGQDRAASLPRIQVDGNRFVDPNGATVVFRGFSVSDPDKLEREGQWNRALFEEARSGWNANIVRIPVHPAAWRERGEDTYLALLDDGLPGPNRPGCT